MLTKVERAEHIHLSGVTTVPTESARTERKTLERDSWMFIIISCSC